MEKLHQPPLIVCMENSMGEDIALKIEPQDDFHSFLAKAKSVLGFDVDINSITQNQPVSLHENIYQFLKKSENSEHVNQNIQTVPHLSDNQLYILDDGTQINSSQIHFDNDDPLVDITTEAIPFFKHINDDLESDDDDMSECDETKEINIVDSPVSCWSSKECSPKRSFINNLPFKMIPNSGMDVVTQFSKYVESDVNKVDVVLDNKYKSRSLIRINQAKPNVDKNKDQFAMTREDVLNMFKDSPVTCAPFEDEFAGKRSHVRKTDPSRPVYKKMNNSQIISYIDVDTGSGKQGQNCFICLKFVEKSTDKLYFFDKEDQKLHRLSTQKRMSAQLKIICEECLDYNFKPRRMRSASRSLDSDEFLIIKNNQQYVFKKIRNFEENLPKASPGFDNVNEAKAIIDIIESEILKQVDKPDFLKLEIGSDGEITKAIDDDTKTENVELDDATEDSDVEIVKADDANSEVEIIEPTADDDVIDNIDETDEEVIEFLGECKNSDHNNEMQCRFCKHLFAAITEAIDHSLKHLYDTEEGTVYPCPLCDYGYSEFRWLRGHLLAAHKKTEKMLEEKKEEKSEEKTEDKIEECLEKMEDHAKAESPLKTSPISSPESSPIATRTRSSAGRKNNCQSVNSKRQPKESTNRKKTSSENCAQSKVESKEDDAPFVISTEVKQEAIDENEEAIWIVQAADGEEELSEEHLQELLRRAKELDATGNIGHDVKHQCSLCGKSFDSSETLSAHKCQKKRGRKRKSDAKPVVRPDNEDLIKKRKKKSKEPTCDPVVVTCNDCKESFTSKVRLKFHMQFHDPEHLATLDDDGRKYRCVECDGDNFATETELFDHVHFQHGKQKRWQCAVAGCHKTFFLRATLTKHSRIHTDTRRYICTTCGKRFLDKQTLDEHGVTHLQIKPFQCHICLKHLTRRSRLRMHLRAHEEELSPRLVHVCDVCSRAFKDGDDAQEHGVTSHECIETLVAELKGHVADATTCKMQLSPTSGVMTQPVHNDKEALESSFHRKTVRRMYEPSDADGASAMLLSLSGQARALIRVVEIEKAFRCEYCEEVYYLENALNAHRLIHKGVKNPFTCHICKVSFPTYSRCTTHKTTHGFYKRSLADVKRLGGSTATGAVDAADQAGSEAGVKREAGGPSATGIVGYGGFPVAKHFLCEDCGRSYLHWTYLQVHRRMKHANENFSYKCHQCDMTFPNSWGIAYHKKKIHGKNQEEGVYNASLRNKENYQVRCRDCDKELPNKSALHKHRREVHGDMSMRLDSKQGIFSCGECGKRYASKPGLEAHLKTHQAQTRHCGCAKCGHAFPTTGALLQHVKEVHSHELHLCCLSCGKRFASRGELAAHARTHAAHRPHACAVCGRAFRTQSTRDEHLRTHTGERPFPCDICGISFRRSSAMRNHRLIHSGERAFPCPRCAKRFRIRSDLRTHLRLKHPEEVVVIEMEGLNPDPEAVLRKLNENGIALERVVDISKVPYLKGTPIEQLSESDVGTLLRAHRDDEASMLWSQHVLGLLAPDPLRSADGSTPVRRGRGIARQPRRLVGPFSPALPPQDQILPDLNIYMDLHGNANQMAD